MPTIPVRLFGKIDYKRATYLFQPEYAVRQALFVDSKAEKIDGVRTAITQTSMLDAYPPYPPAGKPLTSRDQMVFDWSDYEVANI